MVRLMGQPAMVSLVVLVAMALLVLLVMLTLRVVVGLAMDRVLLVTSRAVVLPVMPVVRMLSLGDGGVTYPGRIVRHPSWLW